MRKFLVYGSFGLLSIGWISGCDALRNLRGDGNDTTTSRSGIMPKGCSECQAGASDTKAKVAVAKKTNDPPPAVAKEGMESVDISPPALVNKPLPAPALLPENPREPLKSLAMERPPSPKVLEFPAPQEAAVAKKEAFAVPPLESSVLPPPPPPPPPSIAPLPPIASLPPIAPEPTPKAIEFEPRAVQEKTGIAQKSDVRFGHADQFKSITGDVQEFRKAWRLRYAPIDQVDQYGGVVVLDGGADLSKLRDGQHVRVHGELIPPTERDGAAHYRVSSIELLD